MSRIKDKFRRKRNGLIKIKCASGDPSEIHERHAEMTIDLASDKEITVSRDEQINWPPKIYGWYDKSKVKMTAYQNCTVEPYKSGVEITPDTGVTYFIVKLTNISIGDPDATVTVGEDPPSTGEG